MNSKKKSFHDIPEKQEKKQDHQQVHQEKNRFLQRRSSLPMSESFLLGALLTVVGGYFDVYTYITRGGVFANAQTGNIVLLGINLADGDILQALSHLIPILAFVLGVFTAEFLHTLTLGRCGIVTGKLAAIVTYLVLFDVIAFGVFAASAAMIGETLSVKSLIGYVVAQFAAQLEIASVCFAFSACSKRSSLGLGLGVALVLYVLDIIARITDKAEFLKYITPFSFSNATDIFVNGGTIETVPLCIGICVTVISLAAAYTVYRRRDIAS